MFLKGARSKDKRVQILDTRDNLSKKVSASPKRGYHVARYNNVNNSSSNSSKSDLPYEELTEKTNNIKESTETTENTTKVPRYSKNSRPPSIREAQKAYHLKRRETNQKAFVEISKPKLPSIESNPKTAVISNRTTSVMMEKQQHKQISTHKSSYSPTTMSSRISSPPSSILPPVDLSKKFVYQPVELSVDSSYENSYENSYEDSATKQVDSSIAAEIPSQTKLKEIVIDAPNHTMMFEDKKLFWRVKRTITYRVFESQSVGVVVIRAFDHTNETEVNSILLDRNLILAQVQDLQDAGATVVWFPLFTSPIHYL
mmetsp:Transcript_54660/g.70279  ORF Transcript_54660/g.70279 Transcript_54660/m.70279 type:complete len:314 (-) Transcript_54660:51-992(-)